MCTRCIILQQLVTYIPSVYSEIKTVLCYKTCTEVSIHKLKGVWTCIHQYKIWHCTEQLAVAVRSSSLTLKAAHASNFSWKRIQTVAGAESLADAAMSGVACDL